MGAGVHNAVVELRATGVKHPAHGKPAATRFSLPWSNNCAEAAPFTAWAEALIEKPIFNSKEEAEQYGFELCKHWIKSGLNPFND